jgi:hypothetical protein
MAKFTYLYCPIMQIKVTTSDSYLLTQNKTVLALPSFSSDTIHANDRVSGLLCQGMDVYSVGRDGNIVYSRINKAGNMYNFEVVSVCVPHNKLEMIESLLLSEEHQLCTVGFFGPNFIVENTTHNYKVF